MGGAYLPLSSIWHHDNHKSSTPLKSWLLNPAGMGAASLFKCMQADENQVAQGAYASLKPIKQGTILGLTAARSLGMLLLNSRGKPSTMLHRSTGTHPCHSPRGS